MSDRHREILEFSWNLRYGVTREDKHLRACNTCRPASNVWIDRRVNNLASTAARLAAALSVNPRYQPYVSQLQSFSRLVYMYVRLYIYIYCEGHNMKTLNN